LGAAQLFHHHFRRHAVLLAILLAVATALSVSTLLYKMRANLLDRSRAEAGNLATIIAGQVSRSDQSIELLLEEITTKFATLAEKNPSGWLDVVQQQQTNIYLNDRLLRLRGAEAISFIDSKGRVLAVSRNWPCCNGVDLSERDYFMALQKTRHSAIFISKPVPNIITGKTTIFFARRVQGNEGEFLGVVVIGYLPQNLILDGGLQSVEAGRTIVLARRDGTILFHSGTATAIGKSIPKQAPFHKLVETGGGFYDSPGYFDGVARLVAVRPVPHSTLVVNATVLLDAALQSWWPIAIGSALAFVAIGLICAALLHLLLRQLGKTEISEARLWVMAHSDELTGLPNRAQLTNALKQNIADAQSEGDCVGILFIDLDRFKKVNDSLGHAAGDELLKLVARRLQESLRPDDLLGRLGGDEFIVLTRHLPEASDASTIADEIIERMRQPFSLASGQEIYIGGSVGIATFPAAGTAPDELIQHADSALYFAKACGGGTYRYYDTSLTTKAGQRLEMEARMRRALERGEFVLHYQPILDLRKRTVVGVEALVRWQDPVHGLVPPLDFISLAEESGFIIQLGEWVTETACTQMADWHAKGLELSTMAINISAHQFKHPTFCDRIADIFENVGIAPALLTLEITESALLDVAGDTVERLYALRSLGVQLAIDDFGTGYSSLSYLRRFPINKLKIDRSFVRDIVMDPTSRQIVAAIIALADSLDLEVVAEGIETEAQFAVLARQGSTYGQGYLMAKPMTAAQFEAFYRQSQSTALELLTA
jgi:diguanylate cyclase (GGDEF)-like protein